MAELGPVVVVMWANHFSPGLLASLVDSAHFRIEPFSDSRAALEYFENGGAEARALILPNSASLEARIDFLLDFQARAPLRFERIAVLLLEGAGPHAKVIPLKALGDGRLSHPLSPLS